MQRLLILTLGSFLLFAADCQRGQDAEANLDIIYKATYDGQPLVMFDQAYSYPDGTPLKFQLFNLYISDIILIEQVGTTTQETKISDIELLDFGNIFTAAEAQEGIRFEHHDLPWGVYTGIRFGIGVSPVLNDTSPSDYDTDHPLSENYWSPALDYVFSKVEANADLNGDGDFDDKLTYHIGKDELFQTKTFQREINFSSGGDLSLELEIDVKEMLTNGSTSIDINIEDNTQDHTNNPDVYGFLWENLVNTIQLK